MKKIFKILLILVSFFSLSSIYSGEMNGSINTGLNGGGNGSPGGQVVATNSPVFTPAGGSFASSTAVSITLPANTAQSSTICKTTDGSMPACSGVGATCSNGDQIINFNITPPATVIAVGCYLYDGKWYQSSPSSVNFTILSTSSGGGGGGGGGSSCSISTVSLSDIDTTLAFNTEDNVTLSKVTDSTIKRPLFMQENCYKRFNVEIPKSTKITKSGQNFLGILTNPTQISARPEYKGEKVLRAVRYGDLDTGELELSQKAKFRLDVPGTKSKVGVLAYNEKTKTFETIGSFDTKESNGTKYIEFEYDKLTVIAIVDESKLSSSQTTPSQGSTAECPLGYTSKGICIVEKVAEDTCNFEDTTNHWGKEYVRELCLAGIVQGRIKGQKFKPDENINRAELLKIVMLAFGYKDEDPPGATGYEDVKGEWFTSFVYAGTRYGFVEGYPHPKLKGKRLFKPSNPVIRAEAISMILRTAKIQIVGDIKTTFTDVPLNQWYAGYVAYSQTYGIISGRSANKFDPTGNLTRAEASKIVVESILRSNKLKNGGK